MNVQPKYRQPQLSIKGTPPFPRVLNVLLLVRVRILKRCTNNGRASIYDAPPILHFDPAHETLDCLDVGDDGRVVVVVIHEWWVEMRVGKSVSVAWGDEGEGEQTTCKVFKDLVVWHLHRDSILEATVVGVEDIFRLVFFWLVHADIENVLVSLSVPRNERAGNTLTLTWSLSRIADGRTPLGSADQWPRMESPPLGMRKRPHLVPVTGSFLLMSRRSSWDVFTSTYPSTLYQNPKIFLITSPSIV